MCDSVTVLQVAEERRLLRKEVVEKDSAPVSELRQIFSFFCACLYLWKETR